MKSRAYEFRQRLVANLAAKQEAIFNSNPEGCNQYKGCDIGDTSVVKGYRLSNGHTLESDHLHILKELGNARGSLSVLQLHKSQPGLGSASGVYIKTAMPAHDLEHSGLIEKSGSTKGHIPGIGAGYAGPGSASATQVEKDDPVRDSYRLTEKGHELVSKYLGKNTRPAPKVEEEEPAYDAREDYRGRRDYHNSMIQVAKGELARASGKPRLSKAAKDKISLHEKKLKELQSHPGKF